MWIGDAGTKTGFSRVCHSLGERLSRDYGHDVHVLAVGYRGKEPVETSMHLYGTGDGQYNGFDRTVELAFRIKPDVIITLEDPPFVLRRFLNNPYDPQKKVLGSQWPIISYTPVDGDGFPPVWFELKDLVTIVPMSRYGAVQFGVDRWIYHGVDTDVFYPAWERTILSTAGPITSKEEARARFELPEDAFVIGRVDSNSARKDWEATWRVIELAADRIDQPIVAMFHTEAMPKGGGLNLKALLSRGKVEYRIIDDPSWPDEDVAAFLNACDVVLTTTRGEGFGMTNAEALACGVPVIAPNHSVMPEVIGPGGVLVEPDRLFASPYGHDLRLADIAGMSAALVSLARNENRRRSLGMAGLEHVRTSFSWDRAASEFNEVIENVAMRGRGGALVGVGSA